MIARRERVKEKHGNGNGFGLTLGQYVKMYPTPRTQMSRTCQVRDREKKGHKGNLEEVVAVIDPSAVGGSLNPDWVEWLMGWPVGMTALEQSGTVKFRTRQ